MQLEHLTSRRQFLRISACIAAGTGALRALGAEAPTAAEPHQATAAEPHGPTAAEPPTLLVAVRDAHLRDTSKKSCWEALQSVGAEGVEVEVKDDLSLPGMPHPERGYSIADDAGIERVAADAKAAGVRIAAFCLHNSFDQRPEFELDWVVKASRAAKALGTPVLRLDFWPRKLSGDEFLEFAVDMGKKLVEKTEDSGVSFGVENHGEVTNQPEFLDKLLGGVGSKRFGLTLDTGNFYWFGHTLSSLYEIYQTLAPRVHHTHMKSIKYPEVSREKRRARGWEYAKYNCPIYEGDIDFAKVIAILKKAGYKNALCIEDESLGKVQNGERGAILRKEVEFLKKLR